MTTDRRAAVVALALPTPFAFAVATTLLAVSMTLLLVAASHAPELLLLFAAAPFAWAAGRAAADLRRRLHRGTPERRTLPGRPDVLYVPRRFRWMEQK